MPPKKSDSTAAPKTKASHGSYQDMITDAIIALKDRNGSSRVKLKKYVKANNQLNITSDAMFDSLFNKALKTGVEKGIFEQPKGPSGGTKLAKKAKTASTKKESAPKKKALPKKSEASSEKKSSSKKKAVTPKKKAEEAEKKKKPASKKAASKEKKAAPKTSKRGKDEARDILKKTKSSRVSKPAVKPARMKATPKNTPTKSKRASA